MECPLCGSELPTTYGDGWRDGDEVNCTDPECRAQWFMSVDEDGEAWVQDQDEEPVAAPPDTKATTQGAQGKEG